MFKNIILLAIFSTSSLLAQTEVCFQKLCKGDVVLDSSNSVGQVVGFKNGETLYNRNGNNFKSFESQLSPEVQYHNKYLKNVEYATLNHTVGEIKHFFLNGKFEVEGEILNKVYEKVFKEVEDVQGAKIGTEVVTPMQNATIEKIFENSTAKILMEGRILTIHLLKESEMFENIYRRSWLITLNIKLKYPDKHISPTIGVKRSDYKKLLTLLKNDIQIGFSASEKKLLAAYIDEELRNHD